MSDDQSDKSVSKVKNVPQRIRRLARREGFVARKSRRDGKWYFTDDRNLLVSPESGFKDDEAMKFLASE